MVIVCRFRRRLVCWVRTEVAVCAQADRGDSNLALRREESQVVPILLLKSGIATTQSRRTPTHMRFECTQKTVMLFLFRFGWDWLALGYSRKKFPFKWLPEIPQGRVQSDTRADGVSLLIIWIYWKFKEMKYLKDIFNLLANVFGIAEKQHQWFLSCSSVAVQKLRRIN